MIAEVAISDFSRHCRLMELAREALHWSVNKIKTDPLTFVLSVYVAGYIPAWITSWILAYASDTDLNMMGIGINAFYDAAIWPLKVAGF
ncbi:hypothetical protein EOD08_26000 [Mesorhizobium sp. M6A.T.Ca.TU.002.02.2.1]|nr:hypothetical protein EOD08_26000 [Mesorhizobium sp. M6A.T.Ca.TU.002.02.2.1]